MKTKGKRLVYLRRISQIAFFILFILVLGGTRAHDFLEEERTARLEESNMSFFAKVEKKIPVFPIVGGISVILIAGVFVFSKKKKLKIKDNKNLLSTVIVSSVVLGFSALFTLILGKNAFYNTLKGAPSIRIKISPLFAWLLLSICAISLIASVYFFIRKLIKKKPRTTLQRWLYFSSVLIFALSIIMLFSINAYNPDTRDFTPSPTGVPFFSFNKYLYNFDVSSTLFMETSPLIGISTSIAARVLTVGIFYIFVMLLMAFLFGRAFCGWVCPFGSMHHFVSYVKQKFKKFPKEPYKKGQRIKYIILVTILFSCLFGVTLTGFFDPFSILPKSKTVVVLPSARYIFEKKKPNKRRNTSTTANTEQSSSNNQEAAQSQTSTSNLTTESAEQNSNVNTGQTNPYANAPTRNSYRNNTAREENQESAVGNSNPYANSPTRNSYRGQSGTPSNEQTNTASPYSSSPDRESIRRGQQSSQPVDRTTIRRSRQSSSEETISIRDKIFGFFQKIIFSKKKRRYDHYVINGLVLIILLGLNFIKTRFWCRYICGLGALYGVVGKYSLLRIKQNDNCVNCGACAKFCQGACNPDIKDDFKSAECIYCFNCLTNCKVNALEVKFGWDYPIEKEPMQIDLKKRTIVKGIFAGATSMFLFKTNFYAKRIAKKLVRPPGALHEPDFLERCIKCGNCINVCPNNFLQPTFTEAGLIGMFTPMGNPLKGFCSPTCTLCSNVCPTGAIRHLTEADRGFDANGHPKIKLGTAYVNKNRCITYVYQKKCLVCEEHCPTSPKAIWKNKVTVTRENGKKVTIQQPMVNPKQCIGCGVCVHVCPVVDEPGILLSSVGETRNPDNDFLLSNQ